MSSETSALKAKITADMKAAMKAGDKARLGTIRLALAAIKQKEVDERRDMSDADVLAVIDKMVKQRRDSISQFTDAGRQDLADKEEAEVVVLQDYLPQALSEAELDDIIRQAIADTGAESIKDMGKVMGQVKPKAQGRADMGQVSGRVKALLSE
ncbi:MAG: GatB/YqeY domain-containing protein [Gammaproteobacteria bacterium]